MARNNKQPDYLKPKTERRIRREATRTTNAAYRGDFRDIRQQRRYNKNLMEKRKSDNKYYAEWTENQLNEWRTSEAAEAQNRNQIMANMVNSRMQAFDSLREQNLNNAESGISNARDFGGFNNTQAAVQDNDRLASLAQSVINDSIRGEARIGNLATLSREAIAINAARAMSDFREDNMKLRDQSLKLRDDKRADRLKLIESKEQIEVDKAIKRREFALKKKELGLQRLAIMMDDRANIRDNATSRANNAANNADINDDGAVDAVDLRQRKKLTRETNSTLNNGISMLKSLPAFEWTKFQKRTMSPANKLLLKRTLSDPGTKKKPGYGFSPLQAQAIVDIWTSGGMSPSTKRALRASGYIVPKYWK